MRKLAKLLLCGLLTVTVLAGCSNNTNTDEPTTVGGMMYQEFTNNAEGKSALEIAETLANGGKLPFMAGAMEIEEGFLSISRINSPVWRL